MSLAPGWWSDSNAHAQGWWPDRPRPCYPRFVLLALLLAAWLPPSTASYIHSPIVRGTSQLQLTGATADLPHRTILRAGWGAPLTGTTSAPLIFGDACSAPSAGVWEGRIVVSPYGGSGCTAIKLATTAQAAKAVGLVIQNKVGNKRKLSSTFAAAQERLWLPKSSSSSVAIEQVRPGSTCVRIAC